MRISDFSRNALTSCVAAAMLAATLAGCGGSQPPIGMPGAIPQSSALQALNAQGIAIAAPRSGGSAGYTITGPLLYDFELPATT